MKSDQIFSQHCFIFPFDWNYLDKKSMKACKKESGKPFSVLNIKDIPYDERTDLKKIEDKDIGKPWKRKVFSFKENKHFNQYTYFHRFAAKAIFDSDKKNSEEVPILKYYEYSIDKSANHNLTISILPRLVNDSLINYELNIERICLHLYQTGIGLLSFHLKNEKYEKKSDILKINEFGRRIYPQFLPTKNVVKNVVKNVETGECEEIRNFDKCSKSVFLADSIKLELNNEVIFENFDAYDDIQNENSPITPKFSYRLPKHITKLFKDSSFIFSSQELLKQRRKDLKSKIIIKKILDDRMFFLNWYFNDGLAEKIRSDFGSSGKIDDDWLYAYIFGDPVEKNSIANDRMKVEQLEQFIYKRWIGYGTIYGITNDGFIGLAKGSGYFSEKLRMDFFNIYYQMIILCLAQKVSIYKFIAEASSLGNLTAFTKSNNTEEDNRKIESIIKRIKILYKNYIEFTNKIYFREISPEIQGIELYDMMQEKMNIPDEIKNLENEISELYDFVRMEQERLGNEEMSFLTKVATLFLPLTLLIAVFSLFSDSLRVSFPTPAWLSISESTGTKIILFIFVLVTILPILNN